MESSRQWWKRNMLPTQLIMLFGIATVVGPAMIEWDMRQREGFEDFRIFGRLFGRINQAAIGPTWLKWEPHSTRSEEEETQRKGKLPPPFRTSAFDYISSEDKEKWLEDRAKRKAAEAQQKETGAGS